MIIDAHTHIGAMDKNDSVVTVTDLLKSMDNAGIDISLIFANDVISTDDWHGVSADDVIKQCAGNKRLKVIANISIAQNIIAQIQQLKKHLEKKSIVGLKLYPGYEDYYPTDARLQPIYKFCQEQNLPIVFHTGFLMKGTAGRQEQAHPKHINNIATQFPQLKIVMAHCGNPWVAEAAKIVAAHKHVYADLSGFFSEYESISPEEIADFTQKLEEFSCITGNLKKCLFGTDWPLYSQKEYLKAVQTLPMNTEETEPILWRNAASLYQLSKAPL